MNNAIFSANYKEDQEIKRKIVEEVLVYMFRTYYEKN